MDYSSFRNIPLEWVRAFEVAGRTGSFTAAAKETGLTQAAISQRIGNLEHHMGTSLFVRKARGVTLSVDGEAWLPYVTTALHELEQSYQGLFGSERGTITVSASASILQLWMVPRLENWIGTEPPQISFSTMVLPSDKEHQEASIKIRYGDGGWPDHYKVPLFKEALTPVMSKHIEKAGTQWFELPRIALSGPRKGWREWAHETRYSATPVPRIRFDSFVTALQATLAGTGVMIGSLPLCRERLKEGDLIQPSSVILYPTETYWMIGRKDSLSKKQWDTMVEVFASR